MKFNLKIKLIMIFTGIIFMTGLFAAVSGTLLITRSVMNQAQDKVRTDLNTAREVFNNRTEEIKRTMYLFSLRACIRDALLNGNEQALREGMQQLLKEGNMEMAGVTDHTGKVLYRAHNESCYGDDQHSDHIIRTVLASKQPAAAPEIIPYEKLIHEGSKFTKRAHIQFVTTPKAKPRPELEETAGMMLKAAAPIVDNDGNVAGILFGGDLINRNYSLVDKIKNIVYQGEIYKGIDMGTATIFQKDLRIATNVFSTDGTRAIGTRVSEEVHDRVLVEGKNWIGRAFVVNAWYVSAYEPIRDIGNNIIGMIYVGMLEQKFVDIKRAALLMLFGVTILGMILVLIVSNFFAETITRPIHALVTVSKKISGGDFSVAVQSESKDEIGELEKAFNSMASALQERDEELQQQTQRQLMQSEKLSALGRLAAAMAHSIRNPLTSVKMRLFSMGRKLEMDDAAKEDYDVISKEMDHIESVVRNFLEFSRPPKMKTERMSPSEVVDMALQLLQPRIDAHGITVNLVRGDKLPIVAIDAEQMKEVFVNILLNGFEAMGRGGMITIEETMETRHQTAEAVSIHISDNGPGMPPSVREQVFQPFYSTKEEGSGLGLSIAARIVEDHGGRIDVTSEEGKGTTFTIVIPARKKQDGNNSDCR